jgi:hypothetical protein
MVKLLFAAIALVVSGVAAAANAFDPASLFSDTFWYLIPVEAAAVTSLTATIVRVFKIPEGGWRQAISWGFAFLLTGVFWCLGCVIIPEPKALNYILASVVLGLVSNGFYDIPTIRSFISKIFKV